MKRESKRFLKRMQEYVIKYEPMKTELETVVVDNKNKCSGSPAHQKICFFHLKQEDYLLIKITVIHYL